MQVADADTSAAGGTRPAYQRSVRAPSFMFLRPCAVDSLTENDPVMHGLQPHTLSTVHTILASITLGRAMSIVSSTKCVICRLRLVHAAAAMKAPMTASAVAEAAARTGVTLRKLAAPGIQLLRSASASKGSWRPNMSGEPPAKIWARFSILASRGSKRARVFLGEGERNEVIAAANRVAADCHAALAAAQTEGQQLIAAIADGSFKQLMQDRFRDALAAVQAQAAGVALEE